MKLVTCAIIMDREDVLVTRRSRRMPHPLKWEFPGGKVKDGETPEACIRREIREELGIEISVGRMLPPVIHSYGSKAFRLIPFICQHLEGVIELAEHSEFKWLPAGDLDGLDWLDADAEVLKLLKEKL
ncbi:MAG: (deoxy)nucleoside triphosphate pyrophosphohydrolase [Bacteroidota bacterium]